ncbi:hydroxyethylthiazole kinase [Limosilactobacillus caccae]|uniref:hydroxyethylthiazole kinase n=1 Tax=Limosilactobacillus caccae TaxID=1926284 RepID=UPI0009703EED|nr:hydroxyethylthiazole kinase [Limosilactobacillus caccae]
MQNKKINWQLIDRVKRQNPLVLTVANTVTISKVADALSAIGASPIMSTDAAESSEMVAIADAITINLGTINAAQLTQIYAVLRATDDSKPLVLDPVAVGAIPSRRKIATDLLAKYHFDIIRGNAGEIAALVGETGKSHGIDAGVVSDQVSLAKKCAQKYHAIVVLTGKIDTITDGEHTYRNELETPMLAINVGSGDMLSSIIAAFAAVTGNQLKACMIATTMFSASGVIANRHSVGLGSWQTQFFDHLTLMDSRMMQEFIESEEDLHD